MLFYYFSEINPDKQCHYTTVINKRKKWSLEIIEFAQLSQQIQFRNNVGRIKLLM